MEMKAVWLYGRIKPVPTFHACSRLYHEVLSIRTLTDCVLHTLEHESAMRATDYLQWSKVITKQRPAPWSGRHYGMPLKNLGVSLPLGPGAVMPEGMRAVSF